MGEIASVGDLGKYGLSFAKDSGYDTPDKCEQFLSQWHEVTELTGVYFEQMVVFIKTKKWKEHLGYDDLGTFLQDRQIFSSPHMRLFGQKFQEICLILSEEGLTSAQIGRATNRVVTSNAARGENCPNVLYAIQRARGDRGETPIWIQNNPEKAALIKMLILTKGVKTTEIMDLVPADSHSVALVRRNMEKVVNTPSEDIRSLRWKKRVRSIRSDLKTWDTGLKEEQEFVELNIGDEALERMKRLVAACEARKDGTS